MSQPAIVTWCWGWAQPLIFCGCLSPMTAMSTTVRHRTEHPYRMGYRLSTAYQKCSGPEVFLTPLFFSPSNFGIFMCRWDTLATGLKCNHEIPFVSYVPHPLNPKIISHIFSVLMFWLRPVTWGRVWNFPLVESWWCSKMCVCQSISSFGFPG